HFFDNYVKDLHEILGLFFVLVVLFHILYNFKSMKNYFSKKVFAFSALSIVAVSMAFVFSVEDGNNPKKAMIMSMLNTPIENSTRVFGKNIFDVAKKLELKGISITKGDTIKGIAQKHKISPFEVVDMILQK
ncbi:hypothetical protein, partial [Sulfurimonas sp.]|uniref:hypothetical protein n=1 Tax=Sulfurimonas sp. TaxID=2022749 RepID=UPI0025F01798